MEMHYEKRKTELVATFTPEGEPNSVSVVIDPETGLPEGLQIEGWAEQDYEGPVGIVKIERKPVGFVAALPEHEGW